MRKDRTQLFILRFIFQIILLSPVYSQNGDIKFENIMAEQGLASNIVYNIIQIQYVLHIWKIEIEMPNSILKSQ